MQNTLETPKGRAFQVNRNDIEKLRRRQAESENRLDRDWMPEAGQPVMGGGTLRYQLSGRARGIECGGLGLIRLLVQRLGLAASIDARVGVLKRHLPYRESDHVLNLLYNVISGGSCLQDVQTRREDVGYLEAVGARKLPAPSTEGDFLRRFEAGDVEELMEAFHEARLKVWKKQPAGFRGQATLDADGTLAPTSGECKEGIGLSYTGQWGYHPLLISLAETNEVLYVVNRPGNRPSSEEAAVWLDRAIELARRGGFRRVLLRGDTDFTQTEQLDRWDGQGVRFVFGMDARRGMARRAEQLPEKAWKKLRRKRKPAQQRQRRASVKQRRVRQFGCRNLQLVEERVAEFAFRPRACQRAYRVVAVRKRIRVEQGQRRLFDEVRYLFYLTNLGPETSAGAVVRTANRRCHQENVVEQLKNGVQALRMPSDTLESNWAYLAIAAQAWNLKAWLGLVAPQRRFGMQLLKMEFRRFLRQVIQRSCQILRQGRRLIYRLLAVNEWTEEFLQAAAWLQRVRFG